MRIRLSLIIFLYSLLASAQVSSSIKTQFDVGHNFVTKTYGHIDLIGTLDYKEWTFSLGTGISFITEPNHPSVDLEAMMLETSYQFDVPKFPCALKGKYTFIPNSLSQLAENDFMLTFAYLPAHFDMEIGYMLTYNYSAIGPTSYLEHSFMYNFRGYVWKKHHTYNISIALSNFDDLFAGRTTDVFAELGFSYAYPKNMKYYIAGQIRPAGVGSILFNSFDYKLRLGLLWEI